MCQIVKEELLAIKEEFADERRTKIGRSVSELEEERSLIAIEGSFSDCNSHRGYIKRLQLMLTVLSAGVGGVLLLCTRNTIVSWRQLFVAVPTAQSCSLPTAAESTGCRGMRFGSRPQRGGNSDCMSAWAIQILAKAFRLPTVAEYGEDQYLVMDPR